MKLVFKTHKKPKGLAGIGSGYYIEIKHKAKKIGVISGGSAHGRQCTIQLAVLSAQENCPWSWLFIENSCQNEEEAKKLVLSIIDNFYKKHPIYYLEP